MRSLLFVAVLTLCACGSSSEVSRELGARCDDKDECDERCLIGGRFPGGLCSLTCQSDGECPGASQCADVEGGVCLFSCAESVDCERLGDGWFCEAVAARGEDQEVTVCIGPA